MITRLGRANRHTVHWTYNIQISVGLLPRNSGKLNLISFNCATNFIGTRPYDPENLPPSQTLNEVWGKIMGNNPWTRTGACHTCRWKNKRTKQSLKGRRVGNSQLICENLPMIGQNTEWPNCIRDVDMISSYGNRRTPGTPISFSVLSWDIMLLYRHFTFYICFI